MKEIKEIRVDWHTIWKLFIFLAVILFFYYAHNTLVAFLVGVIFSLGIDPVIVFISEKLKIKRWLAVLLVFIFIVLFLAIFLYLVMPIFLKEVVEFLAHLKEILHRIPGFSLLPYYIQNLSEDIYSLYRVVSQEMGISSTFSNIIKTFIFSIAALVITLYFSVEKDGAQKMIKAVLPSFYEKPILEVFDRFAVKMRRWLGTQLVLSVFVGLMVFIGLSLLGIKYSLFLGIIAAILELVPVIGPIITAVLAFIVAVSQSVTLGIYAVIFFTFIQQFENHILIPLLIGKTMKVHPIIVITSILAGAEIAGFVGVLLGTPLAILVQEILNYIVEEKEKKENRLKI
jgi:predicted PurR-regulated permease PerM